MFRHTGRVLSAQYTAVVVGGGAAGCHIAARLAQDNNRTLLLEEGPDARTKKKWHTELPSAKYLHRFERRYEREEQTTPQNQLAGGEKRPFSFPRPMVLGGAGVMGGRSWILGDVDDWAGSGLNYKKQVQPAMLKVESVESSFEPHRGRRGRFFVRPVLSMSPLYRPFLEACSEMKVPLTAGFNNPQMKMTPACGRTEVCIDKVTMSAQTSLSLLEAAKQTMRPLHIAVNTTVLSLTTAEDDKSKVTGVVVRTADGATETIKADFVVLCAGSTGTPRILQASRDAIQLPSGFGGGLWDSPEVILQFKCRERKSLHCLRDPVVRAMAYFGWRWLGDQSSFMSGFDDMVAFVSSTGDDNVDLKLTIQPFAMGPRGETPDGVDHAFQIVVQLLSPKSRGSISVDGAIDPNYFAVEDDRTALKAGVEMVKKLVRCAKMLRVTDGNVIGEYLTSAGRGGVCRTPTVVDPETHLLNGMSNLYVCDGSIIANPLRGDYLPSIYALTERFVEGYIARDISRDPEQVLPSKKYDALPSGSVKIVY